MFFLFHIIYSQGGGQKRMGVFVECVKCNYGYNNMTSDFMYIKIYQTFQKLNNAKLRLNLNLKRQLSD